MYVHYTYIMYIFDRYICVSVQAYTNTIFNIGVYMCAKRHLPNALNGMGSTKYAAVATLVVVITWLATGAQPSKH